MRIGVHGLFRVHPRRMTIPAGRSHTGLREADLPHPTSRRRIRLEHGECPVEGSCGLVEPSAAQLRLAETHQGEGQLAVHRPGAGARSISDRAAASSPRRSAMFPSAKWSMPIGARSVPSTRSPSASARRSTASASSMRAAFSSIVARLVNIGTMRGCSAPSRRSPRATALAARSIARIGWSRGTSTPAGLVEVSAIATLAPSRSQIDSAPSYSSRARVKSPTCS